jgi:hypothetical protein
MHAAIRIYSGAGAQKLAGLLEGRKSEVERLLRSVKGFVSYSMVLTSDGAASVTVCEDKDGTDDGLAVNWLEENAASFGAAPTVLEGLVILQFK